MNKQFFVDFDGTITKEDVVGVIVQTFCRDGWKEINDRWEKKDISTVECARQTFKLFDAAEKDLYRVLDTIEFDDCFVPFVKTCRAQGYPVYILSDGYDLMIEYLLKKHGLSDLPFFANRLVRKNGGYDIACPYLNPICGQCGTCKKTILQALKKEGCTTVYIGDGYSDTCVIEAADIVYAKKDLLAYCRRRNIPVIPFHNFSDICDILV